MRNIKNFSDVIPSRTPAEDGKGMGMRRCRKKERKGEERGGGGRRTGGKRGGDGSGREFVLCPRTKKKVGANVC
jgi:hypothetical protein